jgi:hypothetical protein
MLKTRLHDADANPGNPEIALHIALLKRDGKYFGIRRHLYL